MYEAVLPTLSYDGFSNCKTDRAGIILAKSHLMYYQMAFLYSLLRLYDAITTTNIFSA